MNKLPRSWLVLLQQLNIKLSVVKCRPLRNHPPLGWYARLPCYAELSREKKPRTLKRTPSGSFFFSNGQRVVHVICVTAHTKSVRSQFQFLRESCSTHWFGGSLLFSLAMFTTVEGSVCLVIAVTKFGLLQKMWALLIKTRVGRVGTNLFGLDGYVLLNRVCRFSRPWVSSS